MVHGDTKCLDTNSAEPAARNDRITLYSMRFCPFCERARLMLAAKNIPHDIVNIDLKHQPEWYKKINPTGEVPTLREANGTILIDSALICAYLDRQYSNGGPKFLPEVPLEEAKQKVTIYKVTKKFIDNFGKQLHEGGSYHNQAVLDGLKETEKLLTADFFAGNEPGFVDIMLWTFLERIPAIIESYGTNIKREEIPKIYAWMGRMDSLSYIRATAYPHEYVTAFTKNYNDANPPYDYGL